MLLLPVMAGYCKPKSSQLLYAVITTTPATRCDPQVFYSFNFWLMFRQQLKERKEAQSLKAESLDEVKVVPRNILLRDFYNYCGKRYHDVFLQHPPFYCWFFSIAAEENQPSPLVAMLISGVKGLLVKYWILFCCSMFFVISFSGKVYITCSKSSQVLWDKMNEMKTYLMS